MSHDSSTQVPFEARINVGHPLALGLAEGWVFGSQYPSLDLQPGIKHGPITALNQYSSSGDGDRPDWRGDVIGQGLGFGTSLNSSGAGMIDVSGGQWKFSTLSANSMVAMIRPSDVSAGSNGFQQRVMLVGAAGGGDGFGISTGASSLLGFTSGGNTGAQAHGLSDDEIAVVGFDFDQPNDTVRLWVNGVNIYEDAAYTDNSAVNVAEAIFGQSAGTGDQNFLGKIFGGYWWDRVLNSREHAALYMDFFAPIRRKYSWIAATQQAAAPAGQDFPFRRYYMGAA